MRRGGGGLFLCDLIKRLNDNEVRLSERGKLSLRLFSRYERLGKRYWGRHLWSRGYCVSTVGLDEEKIRKYVKYYVSTKSARIAT
ncbi:MAG: hypothetical protein GWN00_29140 [Aliifodinibius sp.]|nr:hypothetical protein [Fodinibius sp.]NIV14837.1 hypothetical protein [Fodinibius sp.]NIY28716.1 hypothetical protein [Fodinibius sp.]